MSVFILISNNRSLAGSSCSAGPALDSFAASSGLSHHGSAFTRQPIDKIHSTIPHLLVTVTPSAIATNVYLAPRGDPSHLDPFKLCAHVFATLSAAASPAFALRLPAVHPPSPAAAETKVRMSSTTARARRRAPSHRMAKGPRSRIRSRPRGCQCRSWEVSWATRIPIRGSLPAVRATCTARINRTILGHYQ